MPGPFHHLCCHVAQLAEQRTVNAPVLGSSPSLAAILLTHSVMAAQETLTLLVQVRVLMGQPFNGGQATVDWHSALNGTIREVATTSASTIFIPNQLCR